MKLTLQEADEFLCLPEDTLIQVSVANVEPREVPARDGKEGWTSLNFKFTIIGMPTALEEKYGALIGSPIFGSTGSKLSTHPDNKLRKWAEALLNLGDLDAGFELDTDDLIGKKARAQVVNYTKSGQTTPNHKVGGLLPLADAPVIGSGSSFAFDEPPF